MLTNLKEALDVSENHHCIIVVQSSINKGLVHAYVLYVCQKESTINLLLWPQPWS